jgi:hypothetical protein
MTQKAALDLGPEEPYQFVTLHPGTKAPRHPDANTQHSACLTVSEQPARTGLSVFDSVCSVRHTAAESHVPCTVENSLFPLTVFLFLHALQRLLPFRLFSIPFLKL